MLRLITIIIVVFCTTQAFSAEQTVVIPKSQFIELMMTHTDMTQELASARYQIKIYADKSNKQDRIIELQSKDIELLKATINDFRKKDSSQDNLRKLLDEKILQLSDQVQLLRSVLDDKEKELQNEKWWNTTKNWVISVGIPVAAVIGARMLRIPVPLK